MLTILQNLLYRGSLYQGWCVLMKFMFYHPSRHGELFAEGADQQGSTSSKDLLAAQLGIWTFGIIAL